MSMWWISYGAGGKRILRDNGTSDPYRWYHAVADYLHEHVVVRWHRRHWRRQQAAFKAQGGRFYGDGGTIHHSSEVDVETHDGKVVAVWFRCQPLPFRQARVRAERAAEMLDMMSRYRSKMIGVVVRDPPEQAERVRRAVEGG